MQVPRYVTFPLALILDLLRDLRLSFRVWENIVGFLSTTKMGSLKLPCVVSCIEMPTKYNPSCELQSVSV